MTLGGPIIKNKLFFFVNYENTNKTYPNLNGYRQSGSRVNPDEADDVMQKIKDMAQRQGLSYDGTFANPDIYTKSNKFGC